MHLSIYTATSGPKMTKYTATRSWRDKHVLSHVAFLPCIMIAAFREPPFWELIGAVVPVLVLSTAFHRAHEPRGSVLARCEGVCAHLLYAYGCAQLLAVPSVELGIVYTLFWFCTTITHFCTPAGSLKWDRWHSVGMHLVPGVWCSLVARFNQPLFTEVGIF